MASNFLALEPLIVERLRATLPAQVHIFTLADLAGVKWAQQPTPAVYVEYADYSVNRTDAPGFVQMTQTWLTVIAARNLRELDEASPVRQEAGVLAAQVFDALWRWRPDPKRADGAAGPLLLANAPAPGAVDGFFYLPLAWTAPVTLESTTCPNK